MTVVRFAIVFISLACPITPALGGNYDYDLIADTDGPFERFRWPAINEEGDVAFIGYRDDDSEGVFLGDGNAVTTIADTADGLRVFSGATVSDSGTVAFAARFAGRIGEGIFSGSGGPLNTIVDTDSGEFDGFRNPNVNDNGSIVFGATGFPQTSRFNGIYESRGGSITNIAHTDGIFSRFRNDMAVINNQRKVAFVAELDAGGEGVFSYINGRIRRHVDTIGRFRQFSSRVSINDWGTILVWATLDTGDSEIFALNGSAITTIATSTRGRSYLEGPFASIGQGISINNGWEVVFDAMTWDAAEGVFTGVDPVRDKVLSKGDLLDGRIVADAGVDYHEALNDRGQIALWVFFSDDSQGIYVATPKTSVGTSSPLHDVLLENLFAGIDPLTDINGPYLDQPLGMGTVIAEMQRRGFYVLMPWIPQRGGRCVNFWPSRIYECGGSDLAVSVARAALATLDEKS